MRQRPSEVNVCDWTCNERRLVNDLKALLKQFCSVSINEDGNRAFISLKFFVKDIYPAIECLRLNYDVMLRGDEDEMIIILDEKGKLFSQR